MKVFKYCENPDAEVPIMFIDKEIGGKDADGVPNIQGNEFLKELMFLSDAGKKTIEVWINSPGGIVTEGQSIYTAILASKANVNTVCYGLAASIAGVDFQAGKKRKMFSHAYLMYHPAYSEDGKADKGLEALNKSIAHMVASRTGKTEDEIWAVMNRGRMDDKGTWIGAKEALEMGFCDEIIDVSTLNKNEIISETFTGLWKESNKVFNRIFEPKKINRMKLVLNKLGLIDDANETSAIAAIDAMNKSMADLQKKHDDLKKKLDDCEKEMKAMKDKAKADEDDKAKAKEVDDKAKAKADEEEKEKNANADITKAVADGKIKNDAAVIKTYKDSYLVNPSGTKAIIEGLPLNKTAPSFIAPDGAGIEDNAAEAAARKAGITPGTSKWYNSILSYNLQVEDSKSKIK